MSVTFTKRVNCVLLLLIISVGYGVNGTKRCPTYSSAWITTLCDDDQYCCGVDDNQCCDISSEISNSFQEVIAFVVLTLIVCGPIYCCYRCCRRTSQPGFVYTPAETTSTTVTMAAPPPSQVPYPSMMPYPQQTPYPPQHPINPYYGGPPPPYNMMAQGNFQNASAPTL